MFIEIRAIGFDLTDALRRHVQARMRRAMRPFAREVMTVTARLDDVNADHGGIDKRCSIVVALRHRGMAIAEATCDDLYVAVNEVATRIRRTVERTVRRHVSRERKDRQRPGALITV